MVLPVISKWIHQHLFTFASMMLDRPLALLSWFTKLLTAVSALFPIFTVYRELTSKNKDQPCCFPTKMHQWLNILLVIKSNLLTFAYKDLKIWPPLRSLSYHSSPCSLHWNHMKFCFKSRKVLFHLRAWAPAVSFAYVELLLAPQCLRPATESLSWTPNLK